MAGSCVLSPSVVIECLGAGGCALRHRPVEGAEGAEGGNSTSELRQFPALLRGLRLPQLQLVRMAGAGANFRKMAEALHVTQPAITKMARELERTLGAPLFERGATGVRLSRFGLAVLSQVQRSLAHLEQLVDDLPSHREGSGAALRIGS